MSWRWALLFLMPVASLSAIFVGESTPYGRWEGGYFCDRCNCWYYDPCQTYREFCYPICMQREFTKIAPPCPKVWRDEQMLREDHWNYEEFYLPPSQGYQPQLQNYAPPPQNYHAPFQR